MSPKLNTFVPRPKDGTALPSIAQQNDRTISRIFLLRANVFISVCVYSDAKPWLQTRLPRAGRITGQSSHSPLWLIRPVFARNPACCRSLSTSERSAVGFSPASALFKTPRRRGVGSSERTHHRWSIRHLIHRFPRPEGHGPSTGIEASFRWNCVWIEHQ